MLHKELQTLTFGRVNTNSAYLSNQASAGLQSLADRPIDTLFWHDAIDITLLDFTLRK
jgi:hypothetical protein